MFNSIPTRIVQIGERVCLSPSNKIGLGFSISHTFYVVNDESQDQAAYP